MRDEEMLAEIEDFLGGFYQPTHGGMRVNGAQAVYRGERSRLNALLPLGVCRITF
jgi:hypothetical protein